MIHHNTQLTNSRNSAGIRRRRRHLVTSDQNTFVHYSICLTRLLGRMFSWWTVRSVLGITDCFSEVIEGFISHQCDSRVMVIVVWPGWQLFSATSLLRSPSGWDKPDLNDNDHITRLFLYFTVMKQTLYCPKVSLTLRWLYNWGHHKSKWQ